MKYSIDVDNSAQVFFNEFCNQTVEARDILTVELIRRCIMERCIEEDGSYVISYEGLKSAWVDVSNILIGCVLSQLASEGKIESAWDDDEQDFVFWKKDD